MIPDVKSSGPERRTLPTFVRTVLGDVPPARLGLTLTHEHLVTSPAPHIRDEGDLVLDDEDRAVAELGLFTQAGGSAVVELSTVEYGRDIAALKRISQRADVHVVAATGHVAQNYWVGVVDVESLTLEDLESELLRELEVGVGDTGVRAGIVKAGSSDGVVTAAEERVLTAAGRVQRRTGAPITTHTTAGTMATEQADILVAAGADPRHVCLGHLDRRLDFDHHASLAARGFRLGYDCHSKDWYEPDSLRVDHVVRLVRLGFGDRICLSGDMARRSSWVSWGGGPGYTHIPWRIVPWLRRAGLSDAEVRQIVEGNPRELLTWASHAD